MPQPTTAKKRGHYRKSHMVRHEGGWKYLRTIPQDLREAFGGRTAWVKYLGSDRAAAEVEAHTEDAKYGQLIQHWRGLTPGEQTELLALGRQINIGEKRFSKSKRPPKKFGPLDALLAYVASGERPPEWGWLNPKVLLPDGWLDDEQRKRIILGAGKAGDYRRDADATDSGVPFVQAVASLPLPDEGDKDAGEAALLIVQAQRSVAKLKADYAQARRLSKKLAQRPVSAAGAAEGSKLMALVDLWVKVRRPRSDKAGQKTRLYMQRFVDFVGDMEPRQVTRAHVIKFRETLDAQKKSTSNITQHLDKIHTIFNVALSEGEMDVNPAYKVKARKDTRKLSDRRQDFTTDQIRTILDKAKSERPDYHWIIRLLAYHGARSGEICQLRCDDVTTLHGVSVLRIHDRHEGSRVKNHASIRDVPIHPKCSGIIKWAQRVAKERGADAWLFPDLKPYEQSRAHGFQNYCSRVFLRQKCGILGREHTLHSLRHSWRSMARELAMPEPISRSLMGHSMGADDHGSYGSVPSLQQRAEWIARIDPLKG
jgi:integrase